MQVADSHIKIFSTSLHSLYPTKEKIEAKETTILNTIQDFNSSFLLNLLIKYEQEHISIIQEIEKTQKKIDITLGYQKDFNAYFTWKKIYRKLTSSEKTIIENLSPLPIKDWGNYFKHWYYFRVLAYIEHKTPDLPKGLCCTPFFGQFLY